jgi:hypothetical protein
MKRVLLVAALLLAVIGVYFFVLRHDDQKSGAKSLKAVAHAEAALLARLKSRVTAAQSFIQQKKLSNKYCFLIDMSIHSGRNRFFVYDLQTAQIVKRGLVAHGSCHDLTGFKEASFSNVPNSGCSSLGRYKVGFSYRGNFGKAYKLHGLDATNSKAFERFVVLHSYGCVPDNEIYPVPICTSLGCPMLAPDFLNSLKPLIDGSQRPILLWIYN